MVECTRLESEQTVKGLGSSNLPLSGAVCSFGIGAFLLAMLACATPARADTSGRLSGRVLDARTGRVLAGVRVGAYSPYGANVARSRRDGTFAIVGLATGRNVVTVEAAGYESKQCAYRLLPGGDTRLTFALRSAARSDAAGSLTREERDAASCPRAPIGGGETQDVYVIGE